LAGVPGRVRQPRRRLRDRSRRPACSLGGGA
jgi:hypothetical protein